MVHNQQQQPRGVDQYDDDEEYDDYEQSEQSYNNQGSSDQPRIKKSNKINVWGNSSTMNITPYLYKKVLASPYFKSLYEYKTYHEVLDLIKNIKYIHPFTDGDTNAEPSIAFSLLFKLHTLKLSYKQLKGMLQKDMSTNTKAMALLYVRFAVQPDEMWDYFRDFVNDENNTVNIYTKRM